MVWDGQIIRHPVSDEYVVFYPWELGYGVRNKTTNVLRNGYGCSELETLIEIVTWICGECSIMVTSSNKVVSRKALSM